MRDRSQFPLTSTASRKLIVILLALFILLSLHPSRDKLSVATLVPGYESKKLEQ
jgi:hypothetical protein